MTIWFSSATMRKNDDPSGRLTNDLVWAMLIVLMLCLPEEFRSDESRIDEAEKWTVYFEGLKKVKVVLMQVLPFGCEVFVPSYFLVAQNNKVVWSIPFLLGGAK